MHQFLILYGDLVYGVEWYTLCSSWLKLQSYCAGQKPGLFPGHHLLTVRLGITNIEAGLKLKKVCLRSVVGLCRFVI